MRQDGEKKDGYFGVGDIHKGAAAIECESAEGDEQPR